MNSLLLTPRLSIMYWEPLCHPRLYHWWWWSTQIKLFLKDSKNEDIGSNATGKKRFQLGRPFNESLFLKNVCSRFPSLENKAMMMYWKIKCWRIHSRYLFSQNCLTSRHLFNFAGLVGRRVASWSIGPWFSFFYLQFFARKPVVLKFV